MLMSGGPRSRRSIRLIYATGVGLLIIACVRWTTHVEPLPPVPSDGAPSSSLDRDPRCTGCPHAFLAVGDQGLRLDSTGAAHVAYVGDAVYYAHQVEGTWRVDTVDAAPASIYDGTYQPLPALALDAADAPQLAYLDASDQSVVHARKADSHWVRQVVATAGAGRQLNYETAIALDRAGRARIVYAEDGTLRYAQRTGSEWRIDTIDDTGWSEMYFSIALDAGDVPHVVYFNAFRTTAQLKYATATGGRWTTESVDNSGFAGEFNSIAVDHDGVPHVSYLDYRHDQLKYARRLEGGRWSVSVVDPAHWFGGFTSIALDAGGAAHITYTGVDNQARYASWTGTSWRTQPIESNVWYTALALDGDDLPHVAYYARGKRALEVARWDGQRWVTQRVDGVAPAAP